jgi:hypothetical protein
MFSFSLTKFIHWPQRDVRQAEGYSSLTERFGATLTAHPLLTHVPGLCAKSDS